MSERLLRLRNHLDFIRKSNEPVKSKDKKPHELLVTEAFSYLAELDTVENLLDEIDLDSYYTISNFQFDDLISQHKHVLYHFGKYMKFAEIIIGPKHLFFIGYTPISQL